MEEIKKVRLVINNTFLFAIVYNLTVISWSQFFQGCRKEKEDCILKALYQKPKVLTNVKKTMNDKEVKLSSVDILERMLHKAEGAY